jgi:NAD(P)-dependent dehydrogenase (short-subunit alcohol dehydrogenase family)
MASVLITGCSSGFGLVTAQKFARAGHHVFATMRNLDRAGDLEAARDAENLPITILPLDVRDGASIQSTVRTALGAGPIDVLVNNAGYALSGPVEEVEEDELVAQFDTNVFGLVRMIRAVAPGMRERRAGTIVNVSSGGVYFTPPFSGPYVASKAAVGALSEALRQELRPFGVRVVLIEPGGFATRFGANMQRARRTTEASPYHDGLQRVVATIRERIVQAPDGSRDPRYVADAIYDAVVGQGRQFRYLVPPKDGAVGAGLDNVIAWLAEVYRSGDSVTLVDALGARLEAHRERQPQPVPSEPRLRM